MHGYFKEWEAIEITQISFHDRSSITMHIGPLILSENTNTINIGGFLHMTNRSEFYLHTFVDAG